MHRLTYVVAVYEVDRAFGGPEEGGWWYTTGELVRTVAVFHTEDAAYDYASRYNSFMRLVQRGLRDIGSVIYDGGRYSAYVFTATAPKFFPEERPHYE